MNPDDLIRIARYLASTGTGINAGRPSQADLRRAVSTTYYALFHALAQCCANTLIGATPPQPEPTGVAPNLPGSRAPPRQRAVQPHRNKPVSSGNTNLRRLVC